LHLPKRWLVMDSWPLEKCCNYESLTQ
jgi:hypothetical protein